MIFFPDGSKYTGSVQIRQAQQASGGFTSSESLVDSPGQSLGPHLWAVPHGQGLMKRPDGELYDGEWQHGLRHGRAVSITADRSSFEGLWEEGVRHGLGKLFATAGGSWKVRYAHGVLVEDPVLEEQSSKQALAQVPS